MSKVLVIAQIAGGEVKKATNAAVTFAAKVASSLGGSFSIMALGDDLSGLKDALSKLGADKVYLAEGPGLDNAIAEQWAPTIAGVVKTGGFKVVVSPASSTGKDVMPRLACKLDAGMASEAVDIAVDGGQITYTRPMYAGNVNGKVQITTDVEVVTIRSTEFDAAAPVEAVSPVEAVAPAAPSTAMGRIAFKSFEKSVSPQDSQPSR